MISTFEERLSTLTLTRRAVFDIVEKASKPLKAYDILSRLQHEKPNAKPPTVYRALHYLVEKGFLHRLKSNSTYSICQLEAKADESDESGVDILFVCQSCQSVSELTDPVFSLLLMQLSETQSFSLRERQVEVDGVCRLCAG